MIHHLAATTLTVPDMVAIASLGAGIVVLANFVISMGDRLWGKGNADKEADKAAEKQSDACQRDHREINGILIQQNAHISKLLEHMGDFLHAAELRHQATIGQLNLQHAEVTERLKNIYHQMPKRGGDKNRKPENDDDE